MALTFLAKLYPSSYLSYPIVQDGLSVDELCIKERVKKLAVGGALLTVGALINGGRSASFFWRVAVPCGVGAMGLLTCFFWSYFDHWVAANKVADRNALSQQKFEALKQLKESADYSALRGEFNLLRDNEDKFFTFAGTFALTQLDRPIAQTCQFFESLEWPSEKFKEEGLPMLILQLLKLKEFVSWEDDTIRVGSGTLFRTSKATLDMRKIVGCGDFIDKPVPMSCYIAKAIGLNLKFLGTRTLEKLKKNQAGGKDSEPTTIGLHVDIGQFLECRFPASMISPLLPYLATVPGLVGLTMADIGTKRLDKRTQKDPPGGFGDEHIEPLLHINRQQPFLYKFDVNIGAMSAEKGSQFLKAITQPHPHEDLIKELLQLENKQEPIERNNPENRRPLSFATTS